MGFVADFSPLECVIEMNQTYSLSVSGVGTPQLCPHAIMPN